MAIELEAVGHVRDIIGQIVQEILDLKVTSVSELDRGTQKLLPKSCQNISKVSTFRQCLLFMSNVRVLGSLGHYE